MKYCIGEFSTMLGVSRDTLRLYEKHDIVRPAKDDMNKYRYFHDLDARDLLMSRWYRSMQIPLQDVADLMKQSSLDDISKQIGACRERLAEELRKKSLIFNRMEELIQEIEELEASLYQCTCKHRPGLYHLEQTHKNKLLKNDDCKDIVNVWMEQLPFTSYCFRLVKNELLFKDKHTWDYSWGLTMTEEDVRKLDVEITDRVEYIAPAPCISSVIKLSYSDHFTRDTLQFMFDYIQSAGHTITGDIVGRIILTEKSVDQTWTYVEVTIPV